MHEGRASRGGPPRRVSAAFLVITLAGLLLSSCGQIGWAATTDTGIPVRLGYFPNITHAPAIVGAQEGFFAEELGPAARFTTSTFKAGPEAIEALFSGALDFAYVGPSPSINAFQKSKGEAMRIVAGTTSGGASLVVTPGITSTSDLTGKVVATPQLGNTQDVALRAWLADQGLGTDAQGGGDVSIRPQDNAQTLQTFRGGEIDGAWVPEPWATRLVQEAGGKVLVDERSLWPEGRFVTTNLVVRKAFLDAHPDLVARVLRAHVRAIEFVNADPATAQRIVDEAVNDLTGKALPGRVIETAWANLTFTADPIPSSLRKSAEDAHAVGLLESTDVDGIYDLGPLDAVLRAQGQPGIGS